MIMVESSVAAAIAALNASAAANAPPAAVHVNKKRKLRSAEPSLTAAAVLLKKQRVEEVAAVAKDVMIRLLTTDLSYDATDDEYEKLVQLTQAHPKFKKLYSFPSAEDIPGWVKPSAKKKSTHLRIVAIDCEMCVTVPMANSALRVSNALCRVSAVDGDDMIRSIISDYIVHQPEPGYRLLDTKTDIHGITPEMIAQSKISVAKAQKQLLKYINADTIIVGHSVHGDLASLRIDHKRVIDTAMIYQRKDAELTRSTPGLKCLTKFLLDFEMPDGHDSTIDAQASMLAAKYAARNPVGKIIPSSLELHGPKVVAAAPSNARSDSTRSQYTPTAAELERMETPLNDASFVNPASILAANSAVSASGASSAVNGIKTEVSIARSCRLRLHRIPKGVTSVDIENFFVQSTKIVPSAVESIQWLPKQNRGSCAVTFATNAHAALAFETAALPGSKANKITLDSIGRMQKTVAITNSKGTVFSNVQLGVL
ncbi:Small RNA degrading nuclease 2 [Globisporangium polare]